MKPGMLPGHIRRRESRQLFSVFTRMTCNLKVAGKEENRTPRGLCKYICAGIFLPADGWIFSLLPAFQAKRHESAMANNTPIKKGLPSEISLLPEVGGLSASAKSRSEACCVLLGGEAPAGLALHPNSSAADTAVPQSAPLTQTARPRECDSARTQCGL